MKSSQSGSLPNFSPGYHRSREAKGEMQHPYYTPPSPSFLHSFQSWSHCKSKLFFLWGFSTFCIVGSCVGSAPGCQLQLSLSPSNGFWWQALNHFISCLLGMSSWSLQSPSPELLLSHHSCLWTCNPKIQRKVWGRLQTSEGIRKKELLSTE